MSYATDVFDPLHYGHLLHLEAAHHFGDVVIVALTSDESVRRERGEGRPVFTERQRAKMLGALRCVDHVRVVPSIMEALHSVRPKVFCKGSDYVGRIDAEVEAFCAANEIEIRFTNTRKFSATGLLNELRRS